MKTRRNCFFSYPDHHLLKENIMNYDRQNNNNRSFPRTTEEQAGFAKKSNLQWGKDFTPAKYFVLIMTLINANCYKYKELNNARYLQHILQDRFCNISFGLNFSSTSFNVILCQCTFIATALSLNVEFPDVDMWLFLGDLLQGPLTCVPGGYSNAVLTRGISRIVNEFHQQIPT